MSIPIRAHFKGYIFLRLFTVSEHSPLSAPHRIIVRGQDLNGDGGLSTSAVVTNASHNPKDIFTFLEANIIKAADVKKKVFTLNV